MIDWQATEAIIHPHYAPASGVTGRPAYLDLLLCKMRLVGIWNGGLSDESVEDMANSNLHVMRFLGLALEDDVPGHSVLSRFRTRLTKAGAWDALLVRINRQIEGYQVTDTSMQVCSATTTMISVQPIISVRLASQSKHNLGFRNSVCECLNCLVPISFSLFN